MIDKYNQTKVNWYTWGENYGTANLEEKTDEEKKIVEDLKRSISAEKKREDIYDLRTAIDNLRNDLENNDEYKLKKYIYGEEDSKLREKYPSLLCARYKLEALPSFDELDNYDLLRLIGKKRGFCISGGEIDTERTANMLFYSFSA